MRRRRSCGGDLASSLHTRVLPYGYFAVGEPQLDPPGGLPRGKAPQFVLFTHDDAITDSTASMMQSVTDGRAANGCPLTATMFALVAGSGGAGG